jgi:molecular chaperone GrpE
MSIPSNQDADREHAGHEIDPEATAVLTDTPDEPQTAAQLREALAAAESKLDEARDAHMRAVAELENIRRRAVRDVESAHRYGLEKFAAELIQVLDSLEAGLDVGKTADASSLLAGKEATLKLLKRAFEKFNIREIDPAGAPFDPQQHEAMAMEESPSAEANSVLKVIQKGYELNGRLLRPARVIVAKAPERAGK